MFKPDRPIRRLFPTTNLSLFFGMLMAMSLIFAPAAVVAQSRGHGGHSGGGPRGGSAGGQRYGGVRGGNVGGGFHGARSGPIQHGSAPSYHRSYGFTGFPRHGVSYSRPARSWSRYPSTHFGLSIGGYHHAYPTYVYPRYATVGGYYPYSYYSYPYYSTGYRYAYPTYSTSTYYTPPYTYIYEDNGSYLRYYDREIVEPDTADAAMEEGYPNVASPYIANEPPPSPTESEQALRDGGIVEPPADRSPANPPLSESERALREWERDHGGTAVNPTASAEVPPTPPQEVVSNPASMAPANRAAETPPGPTVAPNETLNRRYPSGTAETERAAERERARRFGIALGRGDRAFEETAYHDAHDEYVRAMLLAEGDPRASLALGLADFALGTYPESAKSIRAGVAAAPTLADSNFDLTQAYGVKSDLAGHRRGLENYLVDHPDQPDGWFLLGFVKYFSGDRAAAQTAFDKFKSQSKDWNDVRPFLDMAERNITGDH